MMDAGSFRKGMIMPTLITQLKGILEQYPDDGQILKELIQNAEDAGASKVVFLMDYTTYGTDPDKLHHRDLAKFQGPALYAYNNAVFSERDWEGIRRLQDSIKADDPLKVGKFGLGFKSIFHITDLPSIYSGNNIGFIDPHKRYFEVNVPGQSSPERTSSYDWNFTDENDKSEIFRLSHQFEPFLQDVFGVKKDNFGCFNGTMFRFPLRTNSMHSDLSNTCYEEQNIKQLINFLEAESEIILLFLKKIENITFYKKHKNGHIEKIININICENNLPKVQEKRRKLCDNIKDNIKNWHTKKSFSVTYPMEVKVESSSGHRKSCKWVVCQQFAGKESMPTERECIDGYLPLVGVASKIPNKTSVPASNEPYGQVFCFLPLPLEEKSPTGFNFHVHGSFAVDQNRRHIKWLTAGQDLKKLQDKDLIWNKFLIEKVLPSCLNELVLYLIEWHTKLIKENNIDPHLLEIYSQFIYSVIPQKDNHHWNQFVESFNNIIAQSLTFFSVSTMTWKSSVSYLNLNLSEDLKNLCKKIMSLSKKDLACLPSHIVNIMPSTKARILNADELCQNFKTVETKFEFDESEKIILLNYFFENVSKLQYLIKVHLLPLSDGTWTYFDNFSSSEKVYIGSDKFPQSLFSNLGHKFLCSERAPAGCKNHFDEKCLNLHKVDSESFVILLKLMLNDLSHCNELPLNVVPWFSLQWLQSVWNCIKFFYPNNLFPFKDLHLIFVPNDRVLKLNNKPAFIGTAPSDNKLPMQFVTICQKLGMAFVESHRYDIYNHESLWGKVILPPKIKSVLTFLVQKAKSKQLNCDIFSSFTSTEIEYFVDNLVSETSVALFTQQEFDFLRTLQIFRTIDAKNKKENVFVSINEVNISTEKSNITGIAVPPCKVILDLYSDSYVKLAQRLSVTILGRNDLIEKAYFPGLQDGFYSHEQKQLLIQYICRNIRFMNPTVINQLEEMCFVSRPGGTLVRPKELFDYKDETLIILLEEESFPSTEWRCPEYYEALIELGLKKAQCLTASNIIDVIENLSRHPNQTRFKSLLSFLDRNSKFLNSELKNKISSIRWVPIKKQKPGCFPPSLPFYGENSNQQLACYKEVLSSDLEKIVGSVYPVVESGCWRNVENYFGWKNIQNQNIVFLHLENLVKNFIKLEKFQVLDLLKEIYEYLNKFSSHDLMHICHNDFPWVWVGDEFVKPSCVVLNVPCVRLQPYCFPLPSEMKGFLKLWQAVGVPKEADLTNILTLIKFFHENNPGQIDEIKHDINIAVNILNHFSETNGLVSSSKLFVPVKTESHSHLKMELLENCVYCDKDWYQQGFELDDLVENLHLIHELIPIQTAERLGVPSCMSKILNAEEFENSFGQSESLTTRLRNLLKDYTDGLAVLKELIQNADDANATEVSFVYDERENSDARTILLDKNMEELQGPAIWCHNNASFTKEDFQNIVKLGGATKEHSQAKVGKFGLGFNSVYNLTEVPIFVSNNSVVFFDPHTKYLGKALVNKKSPGIKLDLSTNHGKIQRLKDQFKPFNGMFGCDFSKDPPMKNYAGTLFRFPLRTKKQARSSEICNKHYDRNEVIQLLNCLNDIGDGLLMFTQNVTKITVYHIADDIEVKDMKEVFSINKTLGQVFINSLNIKSFSYLGEVSKTISQFKTKKKADNSLEFVSMMETSQNCNDETAKNLGLSLNSYKNYWVVSWCTGVELSYQLYCKNPSWLPIGAVAAKLEKMPDSSLSPVNLQNSQRGYLYCFLPLLTKTQLPIHVNGYFKLNSSRTQMYMKASHDKEDERGVWNEALLQDAVALSYCNLLKCLTSLEISDLYNIFPCCLAVDDNFLNIFAESVIFKMFTMDLNIFKSLTNNNWCRLVDCSVIGIELKRKKFASSVRSLLINVANTYGKPLVDIPDIVLKCMLKSKQAVKLKPLIINDQQFYETWFLKNLSNLPVDEKEDVIVQTIIQPELCKYLIGSKCIPVTPSGTSFEFVSNLIDPSSILGPLYDEEDDKFPYISGKISNNDKELYIKKLREFGMRSDSIRSDEIVERCRSIENDPTKLSKRLPILLQLMNDEVGKNNTDINYFITQIKSIKMFPILNKPEKYPFSWKNPSTLLVSCDESFLEDKKLLAGPSCLIIDERRSFNGEWPNLKKLLNLKNKLLPFESLVTIIEKISHFFDENHALRDSNSKKIVLEIMENLYNEIRLLIENEKLDESHFSLLANTRFVLVKDTNLRLFLPQQCSMNISRSLLPYLCGTKDTTLTLDEEILMKFGIKETFDFECYWSVLLKLEKQFNGNKLDQSNLTLSLNVVECIYDLITKSKQEPECDFYMPNMNECLCLASQLKFNNCNWTPLKPEECCHGKVSWDVASKLGIKSVRQDIMIQNQFSLPFGQKEKLVNRIKRILSGYPLNEDILKEMLQNADDAGATEIHFIKDARQLPDQKIFSPQWKPLQGPSLTIYNNKSFTVKDLEGIQNLGEGSKADDITKTGQYGVGFNCVYHLTDVPSFLTTIQHDPLRSSNSEIHEIHGTVLGIFDPNCQFLSEANLENPGALYKVEAVSEVFTDVYKGYLQDIPTYDVSKEGTIFRLPLRNDKSKEKSKLNGEIVTVQKLTDILIALKSQMGQDLFFLKSLECLTLAEIKESNALATAREIHKVRLIFSEEARQEKNKFVRFAQAVSQMLQEKSIKLADIGSCEALYEVSVDDNSKSEISEWIIVQRFGFGEESQVSKSLCESYDHGMINLQPCGGVAMCKSCPQNNAPGKGKGRVFNFLPLPITTDLPFHINGHFVMNHESRRGLWREEHKTFKSEWNDALISQIIVPAFCTLLCYLKDNLNKESLNENFNDKLMNYYKIFPDHEHSLAQIKLLTKEVYKYISEKKLQLFLLYKPKSSESNLEWTDVQGIDGNIFFDGLDQQLCHRMPASLLDGCLKKASTIRNILLDSGMKIINCPIKIFYNFSKAGVESVQKVSPENVLKHLSTSSTFDDLPMNINNTIFESHTKLTLFYDYTGEEICKMKNTSELTDLPFLLTSDNVLHKFTNDLSLFESKHKNIAPHKFEKFIHSDIEKYFSNFKENKYFLKVLSASDAKDLLDDFKPSLLNYNRCKLLKIEEFLKSFNNEKLGMCWIKSVWQFLFDRFKTAYKQKEKEFNSELMHLQNLCIIPVTIHGKIYLYPFIKASCILSNEFSGHSQNLFGILTKLGTPMLNLQCLEIGNFQLSSFFYSVVGNRNNLENILAALEEALFHLKHQIVLTKDECLTILNHFAQDISALESIDRVIDRLRKVPFYANMNNQQVPLGNKTAYVFPSSVPKIDIEKLTLKNSLIFLKEENSLSKLFKFLNCESLTETNAYMKFIFKEFKYLDDMSQFEHLKFLQLIVSTLCFSVNKTECEAFLRALKDLHFIRCSSGELQKASYFYDVENPLFKLIEENFLPPPFNSDMWKPFLTECGLVTELTQSKFIEYAEQVRNLPSSEEAKQVSSLLVQSFNSTYEWRKDTAFLASIKSIPFILSPKLDDRLLDLFPPFNSSKFIAFENSNLFENRNLCWTVSAILPDKFINNGQCLSLMKVQTSLDSSAVFNNMQRFCFSFNDRVSKSSDEKKKENFLGFIKNITGEHLDFLNSSCNDFARKGLSDLECIYVETIQKLVKPIQIATDITKDTQILPYIVKLPLFYGKYENFLLQLGATKKITVKQCAWALEQIKNEIKDCKMDPNYLNISKKLLKMILDLLPSVLMTDLMELKYLYIPCTDEKLHQSNEVACAPEKSQLFKRLVNFDKPLLVNENAKELMKLPDHLKPKLLSELVQEQLLKLGKETGLPSSVRKYEKLISLENFEAAIEAIWMRSQRQDLTPEIRESKIESLHKKLKCIKIIGVESIETHVLQNGIPIKGSNSNVKFHFEVHNQESSFLKVYVTENLSLYCNFDSHLSDVIMNFCGIGRSEASLLELLLKTDCNNIEFFMGKYDLSITSNHGPALGNEIRLEDHFKLIQDVLVLYPKQLVAYEVMDPFDKDEDGEAKYILVEVIEKMQNDSQSRFNTKYEINFGSHTDIVDAAKLYAFKSGDDDKSDGCVMLPVGTGPNSRNYSSTTMSLKEALDEMKNCLKDIWVLKEDQKRKFIKRMFLKYHPDKNPNKINLFTELFKHLQILIEMLEDGENIDNYGSGEKASSNSSQNFSGYYSHSSSSYFNESFFDRMGSRAKHQNYSQRKNNSGYAQYTSYRKRYETFFNQFSRKPNRCPKQANLWMKQAEHDYESARNDGPDVPSWKASAQWRCYKYYMAAQNSVTATHYAKDYNNLPDACEKLASYCSDIYDQELDFHANNLDDLLKNKKFLSQPSMSSTAFENITEEMAEKASEISQNIMAQCKKFIIKHKL